MAYSYLYYPSDIVGRVVNAIVGVVVLALGLRLLLQIFGANPAAGFVAWMYGITDPLVSPFVGMFPAWNLAGFILDFSTILAMLAYALLGWLVLYLFSFLLNAVVPYEYEPRVRDLWHS